MNPIRENLDAVNTLVNVDEMLAMMSELTEVELPTDFTSFEAAVAYASERFTQAGTECENLCFPADGQTEYHTYTSPIGFRTHAARCETISPERILLGDRSDEPLTAVVGTGHTGAEGVVAEVVRADSPEDLTKMGASGKLVYCRGVLPSGLRAAVLAAGGLGIIGCCMPNPENNYDHVCWTNTWDPEPDGWLPTKAAAAENLPGVCISPRMGDRLQALLSQGPVTAKLTITGEYFEGSLPSLYACGPGDFDQDVLITAHLFECGMDDNASGVTVSWATADILRRLADRGKLAKQRRRLCHFHGQECYAVLALHRFHPEIVGRCLANLTIDQVVQQGVDLVSYRGLLASSGFHEILLDLIAREVRAATGIMCRRIPLFDINCNLLAEPALGGVPSSWLGPSAGATAYHSSLDRPGSLKVDLNHVRGAALFASTWAAFLTTASTEEALWLLNKVQAKTYEDLHEGRVQDACFHRLLRCKEVESLKSLVAQGDEGRFAAQAEPFLEELAGIDPGDCVYVPAGTPRAIGKAKCVYPHTLVPGPVTARFFTEDERALVGRSKWSARQLAMKAWADGSRNVYDIARFVDMETPQAGGPTVDEVLSVFEVYAHAGIVELRDEPSFLPDDS